MHPTSINRNILFCITIDTEADAPKWDAIGADYRNIGSLPDLHEKLIGAGGRPTYLVTHGVLAERESRRHMERIAGMGGCEIGAHLHPLVTPPAGGTEDSCWCHRLPKALLHAKIDSLTGIIAKIFPRPASFRAGRFGIDNRVLLAAAETGYCVDSSVTPFISWHLIDGPDFLSTQTAPHRIRFSRNQGSASYIWEVPLSIRPNIGNGTGMSRWWLKWFGPEGRSRSGIVSTVYRSLRVVKPIWLRPTYASLNQLIHLARRIINEPGSSPIILDLMFHSNECAGGTSPFHTNTLQLDEFIDKIIRFIQYAMEQGWKPTTLKEATTQLESWHQRQ